MECSYLSPKWFSAYTLVNGQKRFQNVKQLPPSFFYVISFCVSKEMHLSINLGNQQDSGQCVSFHAHSKMPLIQANLTPSKKKKYRLRQSQKSIISGQIWCTNYVESFYWNSSILIYILSVTQLQAATIGTVWLPESKSYSLWLVLYRKTFLKIYLFERHSVGRREKEGRDGDLPSSGWLLLWHKWMGWS